MGRKTYSGGAADTTLNGAITSTATTLVLTDGSSYPSPSVAAPMVIVVGPGTAAEEQILISSRSGNTLSVAAAGRNYHLGGSGTGVAHDNGEAVKHVLDYQTVDEANDHVNTTTRDDHSQYHNAARFVTAHDVTARHPTAVIADGAITAVKLASEAWTAYTPTLTQTSAVTKTVTYAKYQRVGRLIVAQIDLSCTGAGTADGRVIVGAPVTAATAGLVVGSGYVYDASANLFYIGVAVMLTTTTLALMGSGAVADYLGAGGFTAALAASDLVRLSVTYEAAS